MFLESGTAADKELPEDRDQHDVRTVYSTCGYRCSRKSTDVNKGTFCTVKTFYWIITQYHELLETSYIQDSTHRSYKSPTTRNG